MFERFELAQELLQVRGRPFARTPQRRGAGDRPGRAVGVDLGEAVLAVERDRPDEVALFDHGLLAVTALGRLFAKDLPGDEPDIDATEPAQPGADVVGPAPRMQAQ